MAHAVTFHAAAMSRALAFCDKIVERRNTIPILGNVKIDVSAGTIAVTATDLDIEGHTKIEAETATAPFSFTIGAKSILHFVKNSEGSITATVDSGSAHFSSGDMEMSVNLMCPAEDFPHMAFAGTSSASISEAVLHKSLRYVQSSISSEETRYYLNGAYLHPIDGKFVAVTTDGHRLSKYSPQVDWALGSVIVPRKTIGLLIGASKENSNHTITVRQDGLKLSFVHPNWTITTKTIDGKYFDYTRVIPKPTGEFEVVLSDAQVKRFPPKSFYSRAAKISLENGVIAISEIGEASISMKCSGKGGPIGFNIAYLQSFAKTFGTIKLTGSKAGDPAIVTTEDPAFLGVIMPMRA